MDKNHFSRLEKRIQTLVEGGFARLFAGRLHAREVALELARAMEDNAQVDGEAHLAAPNRYIVRLHSSDHAALIAAQPDLATRLAQHVIELARESEMWLDVLPDVILLPDDTVAAHSVQVTARYLHLAVHATQAMTPIERSAVPPGERMPSAFLVVDGNRYVPLDRPVINIGRRHDNTIVIDDPRVSRQHAQLRLRFGRFVVYDLGSRGGTTVNEAAVTECVLRANDVIGLAGVQVVYVEEEVSTGSVRTQAGDTAVRPIMPPSRTPTELGDHGPLLWDDEDGDGGA